MSLADRVDFQQSGLSGIDTQLVCSYLLKGQLYDFLAAC